MVSLFVNVHHDGIMYEKLQQRRLRIWWPTNCCAPHRKTTKLADCPMARCCSGMWPTLRLSWDYKETKANRLRLDWFRLIIITAKVPKSLVIESEEITVSYWLRGSFPGGKGTRNSEYTVRRDTYLSAIWRQLTLWEESPPFIPCIHWNSH